ncbi:MAG: MaoC family dehydratase N-terminal domain-containing protein [Henriciella sp.]
MLNRECIGQQSEERNLIIEQVPLKLFAKAIGETNPIYFDEGAAKAAGYKNILVPPTYGSCLRFLAPAQSPSADELGLDYKGLLHAEESIEYFAPMFAGDQITLVTTVQDIYSKKNGALEFLVRVTRITNQQGELLQNVINSVVMRNPDAAK